MKVVKVSSLAEAQKIIAASEGGWCPRIQIEDPKDAAKFAAEYFEWDWCAGEVKYRKRYSFRQACLAIRKAKARGEYWMERFLFPDSEEGIRERKKFERKFLILDEAVSGLVHYGER